MNLVDRRNDYMENQEILYLWYFTLWKRDLQQSTKRFYR